VPALWGKRLTTPAYDLAVVGSGFAGSLLAAIASRLGRSVILLEKRKHPRFTIGESSTPLANLLLENLTTRYNLPTLRPLAKWGSWQQSCPQIACGLKRGFTFYHHTLGAPATGYADRAKQLLVAASPHNKISDTHWYRAEFDEFFIRQAQDAGVEYLDEIHLEHAAEAAVGTMLQGHRHGSEIAIHARFVVDATGPGGFLHRALQLTEMPLPHFPKTQALYSHFSGVARISPPTEPAPYPVDDAAVHHVFDGGWIWVLHFNNGITSAGAAVTDTAAHRLRLSEGAPAWHRLLQLLPRVNCQFASARIERAFTYTPRLSFRSGAVAGKRWALLPSAAGFVDPLLSTGFTLTLLGVKRLAEIIERDWGRDTFSWALRTYAAQTDRELLAAARLIAALYNSMTDFPRFVSLSLLYFAAVSYAETVTRLGKPHLATSFLLCDHPSFGPQLTRFFDRLHSGQCDDVNQEILTLIEPFNVAGLGNPARRNWYPVDASDLFSSAAKVNATRQELVDLLNRSEFWSERASAGADF
jgi:FADH2 O2-dependent halogenase